MQSRTRENQTHIFSIKNLIELRPLSGIQENRVMIKITIDEMKAIAKKYKLHPCRIKGKDVINIRKKFDSKCEDISWEEFEKIMKKRKLAIYKADESDFVKLMKDKK